MDKRGRFVAILFLVLCAAVAFTCFRGAIRKPFTLDETDIIQRANLIRTEGPKGPFIAAGKNNAGEAIPHPPLCEYVFALLLEIFGESENVARGFGIFCYIVIGSLTGFSLWRMMGEQDVSNRRATVFLFAALYLVNPLLIQHSMLIDSDTTCEALFGAIFICGFVLLEKKQGRDFFFSRFYLAGIFALAYLSKEGTPSLIATALVLFRVLNRQWKRFFLDLFFVIAAGTAAAWAAWSVFCLLYGIDIFIFFKHQYAMRVSRVMNLGFYKRVFFNLPFILRWPGYWVSAPFFAAVILSLALRLVNFFRQKSLHWIDYWTLTALLIWTPFLLVKPSIDMMKYQYLAYPFFIALVAHTVFSSFKSLEERIRSFWVRPGVIFFLVIFVAAAGIYYYRLGDYILFLFDNPKTAARWKPFIVSYYGPIAFVFLAALITAFWKKTGFLKSWLAASALMIFPIHVALDLRQAQASYTTVESWLNYGESGFEETVRFLAKQNLGGLFTCIRKDMVYYLKRDHNAASKKNFDPVYLLKPSDLFYFSNLSDAERPDLIVFDRVCFMSYPPLPAADSFLKNYRIYRKFGDFIILINGSSVKKIR